MSKFAIVLCVAFLAVTTNGFPWTKALKNGQQNVHQVINATISMVERDLVAAQMKTVAAIAFLKSATNEILKTIHHQVSSVTNKKTIEIIEFAKKSIDVNITECMAMMEDYRDIANEAILSTNTCIDDKLKIEFENIYNIDEETNQVLFTLKEARNKTEHCGDDVNDAMSTVADTWCTEVAAADAIWMSIRTAAKLIARMTRLNYSIAKLRPYFGLCTVNTEFANFYRESFTIVGQTQKCIEKKMAESLDHHDRSV